DQRLTTNNRQVQRAIMIDQLEHSFYQRSSLVVADLPQKNTLTQMVVSVRVTACAMEGTFFRNFDREEWSAASQDGFPTFQNVYRRHIGPMRALQKSKGVQAARPGSRNVKSAESEKSQI